MLVKLEEADSSSKALVATVTAATGDSGGGRRRRDRGRTEASGAPDAAVVNADGEVVKVCVNTRDYKTCDRGSDCCFSHDPVALQEARKEVAAQARANGGGEGGKGDKCGRGKR